MNNIHHHIGTLEDRLEDLMAANGDKAQAANISDAMSALRAVARHDHDHLAAQFCALHGIEFTKIAMTAPSRWDDRKWRVTIGGNYTKTIDRRGEPHSFETRTETGYVVEMTDGEWKIIGRDAAATDDHNEFF
jgi:hypothetical protein